MGEEQWKGGGGDITNEPACDSLEPVCARSEENTLFNI